jgi:hypothetical protein
VPELQVRVALALCLSLGPPTTAKSLTVQPGLIGHGRYVGKSPAVASASANPSYDAWSGRRRTGVGPWSGQAQPFPGADPDGDVVASGVGQRGHSVRSGMGERSRSLGGHVKA